MNPEDVPKKILRVAKIIDAGLDLDDSSGEPLGKRNIVCKVNNCQTSKAAG